MGFRGLAWLSALTLSAWCLACGGDGPEREGVGASGGGGGAGGSGASGGTAAAGGTGGTGGVPAPPGAPAIFFLDVTSGPPGAFVTIRGSRLAGGEVAFAGAPATDVRVDRDDWLTVVVPDGATTGPVTVTTSRGTATGPDFTVRDGAMLYVSPAGSDANPGTEQEPFATIAYGSNQLGPGDFLWIRAGTYDEAEAGTGIYVSAQNSGTPDAPQVIGGYPAEEVIVSGDSSPGAIFYVEGSYVVLTHLTLVHAKSAAWAGVGDYNRLANCVLRDAVDSIGKGQGANITEGSTGNEILGNVIDNNPSHGMYVKGNAMRIAHNAVSRCKYGIHAYTATSELFQDAWIAANWVWDNRESGLILAQGCRDAVAENNVMFRNARAGIYIDYASSGNLVANNTLAENGHSESRYQLWLLDAPNNRAVNNLIADSEGRLVFVGAGAAGSTLDNNLYFAPGTPSFRWDAADLPSLSDFQSASGLEAAGVWGDPAFVDGAADDFHLSPGSAAIDTADPAFAPLGDFDGTARPQAAAPDIGAYEHSP